LPEAMTNQDQALPFGFFARPARPCTG
jgi:hypothetical protein